MEGIARHLIYVIVIWMAMGRITVLGMLGAQILPNRRLIKPLGNFFAEWLTAGFWVKFVEKPPAQCCGRRRKPGASRAGDTGAGGGNRTLVLCLEGSGSTIELRPRCRPGARRSRSLP